MCRIAHDSVEGTPLKNSETLIYRLSLPRHFAPRNTGDAPLFECVHLVLPRVQRLYLLPPINPRQEGRNTSKELHTPQLTPLYLLRRLWYALALAANDKG